MFFYRRATHGRGRAAVEEFRAVHEPIRRRQDASVASWVRFVAKRAAPAIARRHSTHFETTLTPARPPLDDALPSQCLAPADR
jgi:hypothetical protein